MRTRANIVVLLCIFTLIGTLLAGCGGGGSSVSLDPLERIVYVGGTGSDHQIYSVALDGTDAQKLTSLGMNEYPSASSNGKIVFLSDRTGHDQVYIMDANGSNETQVTAFVGPVSYPAISGDGSKIVYSHGADFIQPADLYIADPDGGNATVIPNTSGAAMPSLNSDASQITFMQFDGVHNSVFVMDIDGSDKTNMMTAPRTLGEAPKFSPDGGKIVYYADTPSARQIVIYDIAGATETVLDGTGYQYPCFSPDGTKIIFDRVNTGFLYSMGLDGTGEVQLTTGGLEQQPYCASAGL
jgi:Tol biopolymer transport system component